LNLRGDFLVEIEALSRFPLKTSPAARIKGRLVIIGVVSGAGVGL